MNTPKLDHRITIQQNTPTVDDYGGESDAWSDFITVSAERRDVSAREGYRAQEVGAEISARYKVRYSPDMATVTPKDRLVLENGPTYNITGIRETQRNKWIEIDCVVRSDK